MPVLHASPRSCSRCVSLWFLFPFLTSSFCLPLFPTNPPQAFPISGSLALCLCTHGLVSRHGMRFPCLSSAVVFSPTFPVASFSFLSSGFLHLSSTVSPLTQVPGSIIPGLLTVSGSTTPSSGFGSVARGVCRSSHHTTLPERQLWSERQRLINISLNEVLWTGNRGHRVLISTALQAGNYRFLNILRRALSADSFGSFLGSENLGKSILLCATSDSITKTLPCSSTTTRMSSEESIRRIRES